MEEFECICQDCGSAFLTNDESEIFCKKCWEKKIKELTKNEGKGE